MKRRFGLAAVWCICTIVVAGSVARSQPAAAEYQVKAAFLYNFAKFVEWPPQAFPSPDSPLRFVLLEIHSRARSTGPFKASCWTAGR